MRAVSVGGVKVLAVADVNPEPGLITQMVADGNPDLVVLLGDLDGRALQELRGMRLPKLGVYGNHCHSDYLPALGAVNMHGMAVRGLGIRVAGLEGCPRYKDGADHLMTEEEASAVVARLRAVDLVITHCPPRGINDDPTDNVHAGWPCLRRYVQSTKPRYLLHGHTYPRPGEVITRFEDTEVRYVHGTELLDLNLP